MQQSTGPFSLLELAEAVQGKVVGKPEFQVSGLATLESAGPADLSFVARPKFRKLAQQTAAGALLVNSKALADTLAPHCIVVADPYLAYAQISHRFWNPALTDAGIAATAEVSTSAAVPKTAAIGPRAVIDADVTLGEGVEIGAGCYVGAGVRIGEGTRLRPNVTLYPGTRIGADCLIHSGAVIGSDGFGFAPTLAGWTKIAQLGGVIIGDRCEIGANTTIDRGALDDTVIGDDVIIDNLVQIAHNVELGSGSAMAGQSGIAGSAKVGRRVMVGGQSAIGGHISIADGVQFNGRSMVNKSITEAGTYASGIPVQPVKEWRKMVARVKNLNALSEKITALWRNRESAGAANDHTDKD